MRAFLMFVVVIAAVVALVLVLRAIDRSSSDSTPKPDRSVLQRHREAAERYNQLASILSALYWSDKTKPSLDQPTADRVASWLQEDGTALTPPNDLWALFDYISLMEILLIDIQKANQGYSSLQPDVSEQIDDYLAERRRRMGA